VNLQEGTNCDDRKMASHDMAVTVALPPALSPKTPCGIFAALALSPTVATGHASSVPALHLSPPTPTATGTRTEGDELPSPFYSPAGSLMPISPDGLPTDAGPVHRRLALNEARQLGLLLMQQLFPVRNNVKGITRESILLADKLHDAGVRWDKLRRVMGMHLRGIWEEGQRFGNGRGVTRHSAMEWVEQFNGLCVL